MNGGVKSIPISTVPVTFGRHTKHMSVQTGATERLSTVPRRTGHFPSPNKSLIRAVPVQSLRRGQRSILSERPICDHQRDIFFAVGQRKFVLDLVTGLCSLDNILELLFADVLSLSNSHHVMWDSNGIYPRHRAISAELDARRKDYSIYVAVNRHGKARPVTNGNA